MKLVGVPGIQPFESPASWMARAALSQGINIKEFKKFIGMHRKADPDISFTQKYTRHVASVTGVNYKEFSFIQHMLTGLRQIDRHGTVFLLGSAQAAQYRFCSVCLAKDRTKTFPLHWRFKCWRWCPLHDCLMMERCPHCKSLVYLPQDMFMGGPKKAGVASLDRCLSCGKRLNAGWTTIINSLDLSLVPPWEQSLMDNGRAVLAAIYYRRVELYGEQGAFSFSSLKRIQKNGLLPHRYFSLTHDELIRRREKRDSTLNAADLFF